VDEWAKNVIYPAADRVRRNPFESPTAATLFVRYRRLQRRRREPPRRV
jgi:hypothetical protein